MGQLSYVSDSIPGFGADVDPEYICSMLAGNDQNERSGYIVLRP